MDESIPGSLALSVYQSSLLSVVGSENMIPIQSLGSRFATRMFFSWLTSIPFLSRHSLQIGKPPTREECNRIAAKVNALYAKSSPCIFLPTTANVLSRRGFLAMIGGVYHEAWHILYTCQTLLTGAQIFECVHDRWGDVPWHKVLNLWKFLYNIYEDIRIERIGNKAFPGAQRKLYDLQDLILTQEESNRQILSNLPKPLQIVTVTKLALRDIGLGYRTNQQESAMQFYEETCPEALDLIKGPLAPTLRRAIHATEKDHDLSLILAMDTLLLLRDLLHANHPPKPEDSSSDGDDSHGDGDDSHEDGDRGTPGGEGEDEKDADEEGSQEESPKDNLGGGDEEKETEESNQTPEGSQEDPSEGSQEDPSEDSNEPQGGEDSTDSSEAQKVPEDENGEGDPSHDPLESDTGPSDSHNVKEFLEESEPDDASASDWKACAGTLLDHDDAFQTPSMDYESALNAELKDSETKRDSKYTVGEAPLRPYTLMNDKVLRLIPSPGSNQRVLQDLASLKPEVNYIIAKLNNVIRAAEKAGTLYGVKRGNTLSGRHLVDTVGSLRCGVDPQRAFLRKSVRIQQSMAAGVILDESLSMRDILTHTRLALLALLQALDAVGCATMVTGFQSVSNTEPTIMAGYHRVDGITHHVFKHFGMKLASSMGSLLQASSLGSTPMADGIEFSLQHLKQRKEAHKFLFVMTDGMPDPTHFPVVKGQIRLMDQEGIHPIGVGLGPSARVEQLFPDYVKADKVRDLPAPLTRKVLELVENRILARNMPT